MRGFEAIYLFLFLGFAALLILNLCTLFMPSISLKIELHETLSMIEGFVNGIVYNNYTIIVVLATLSLILALFYKTES